ncbi:DUF4870 domain-containing protein [Dyella solisilvae]|uniref:DUF4870 domain-containing protein n=1 Tax=Dyella solisilvae TaxID=1920168 RepID=A0A370K5F7_9GAMM|nr:DUF4870 domain-containing protein [Dyella solisilvae]RDI97881.1 DUF4870 domain-containing protein [Dyella solisilvae]
MSVPPESVVPPPNDPAASSDLPSAQQRQWAMFAHLSALLGLVITGHWLGWGCFLGPLVIWLVKKDAMPFVDDQGKEALNFNITVAIVFFALFLLTLLTLGLGVLVAWPVGVVVGVAWLVFTIVAAIRANEGVRYRYPFTLRLIR